MMMLSVFEDLQSVAQVDVLRGRMEGVQDGEEELGNGGGPAPCPVVSGGDGLMDEWK